MIQTSTKYINDIKFNGSSINRIYLNNDVYWGGDGSSSPVYTYELLKEIHAVNYTTFVDTGVQTSSAISIETSFRCNPDNMPAYFINQRIIASTSMWNSNTTMAYDFEDQPFLRVKFIGDFNWTSFQNITPDSNDHIIYLSSTECKYDNTVIATHAQTSIHPSSTQLRIAQSNIYQPEIEQGYYYYYYVKIWDSNNLIRHYVPAKRLADNVYGFYDIVNDTFNPSVGNYQFTGTSKSVPEYI